MKASEFIKNFNDTEKCDHEFDFTQQRKSFEEHMGSQSYKNIIQGTNNTQDRKNAMRAFNHYRMWNESQLKKSLTLENQIMYYANTCLNLHVRF